MRKGAARPVDVALGIVSAVVGAGFASGREVLQFFSRFGAWSFPGAALAAALMALLAWAVMNMAARADADNLLTLSGWVLGGRLGPWAGALFLPLMWITASAMIAGMGELAALSLPFHGAQAVGIVFALCVGGWGAWVGEAALAAGGAWLLPACLLLDGLLLSTPSPGAQALGMSQPNGAWVIPLACAYASMNMALSSGVLCESGRGIDAKQRRQASLMLFVMLCALLFAANAVIAPYAAQLRDAALPMVVLARALGKVGYWLCILCLSLAMYTSLVAMLRSVANILAQRMHRALACGVTLAGALLLALVSFNNIIGVVYPVLGWVSAGLLLLLLFKAGKRRFS